MAEKMCVQRNFEGNSLQPQLKGRSLAMYLQTCKIKAYSRFTSHLRPRNMGWVGIAEEKERTIFRFLRLFVRRPRSADSVVALA